MPTSARSVNVGAGTITCNYDGADQAPHRHRGRLLHRLGRHAGGAGAHRARLLHRRRLDHQQGHAAPASSPWRARGRCPMPVWKPPKKKGLSHVRHRRRGLAPRHRSGPGRRAAAARIPRLRLVRRRGAARRRAATACAAVAPRGRPRRAGREDRLAGGTGIAHTRWATHGAPATQNAHPIISRGEIAVVHNGIIENHEELRATLQRRRATSSTSQTDTEVIAHLMHSLYKRRSARRRCARAVSELHGAYAIAVVCEERAAAAWSARAPAARSWSAWATEENFLASDALGARRGHATASSYLEDGDVRRDPPGRLSRRRPRRASRSSARCAPCKTSGAAAELGPYRHFMQKEIFEQPRAVADTLECSVAARSRPSSSAPRRGGGAADVELAC